MLLSNKICGKGDKIFKQNRTVVRVSHEGIFVLYIHLITISAAI